MMKNRAFIFDSDAILCRQSSIGWWPLSIDLSQYALAVHNTQQPIYQLGRVSLFEALAPQHWLSPRSIDNDSDINAPITSAITLDYAHTHHIDLPFLSTVHKQRVIPTDKRNAFIPYRQLITQLPAALTDQLSQAMQLLRWQIDTKFCSRCGSSTLLAPSGERAMVCSVCHLRQYPRVQPCVITAITRPNPSTGETQILLAHHHRYGQSVLPLQYGLIAGFVEVGESLEHAVVREVYEEVGIELSDIRYVSSQPWPFPSNLMLGFRANYASGDIVIQKEELSHADFFDISALPKIPARGSIAHALIAQIAHEYGLTL